MAPTTVGPFHHPDSSGSLVGGVTRLRPRGPTAGSHCMEASLNPQVFRKGSSCALMYSKRSCNVHKVSRTGLTQGSALLSWMYFVLHTLPNSP
jgi:hypothetical protein